MRKTLAIAVSIGLLMCGPLFADWPASHGRSQPARTPVEIEKELAAAPQMLEQVLLEFSTHLQSIDKRRKDASEALRKRQVAILELEKMRAAFDEQLLQSESEKTPNDDRIKSLRVQIRNISEEINRESKTREELLRSIDGADRAKRHLELNKAARTRWFRELARDAAMLFTQDPSSDSRFVEGILAALTNRYDEGNQFNRDAVELLALAARRDWKILADETSPAMLRRQREAFEKDDSKTNRDYRKLRDALIARTTDDERLTQQERELLWSDVLATVIQSMSADDPTTLFRDRASRDPRQATAYYLGYQAIVEARPTLAVNIELLLPIAQDLLPADLDAAGAYVSLLQTLAKRLPADQPDFVRLRTRLVHWLKTVRATTLLKESNYHHPVLAMLASLINTYSSNPQLLPAGRELLETLSLTNRSAFYEVTVLMKMPAATQRAWLLKTTVDVSFDGDPARDALRELANQVKLPVWIDEAAVADLTPVRLKTKGPWFDVLNQILAQTSLTADFLSDGILWIGPKEARQQAEATLGRSLLRVPDATEGELSALLRRSLTVDFHETPMTDVIEFLRDYTGINVIQLAPRQDAPISFQSGNLPVYLVLTLIADKTGADWRAGADTIAIGPPRAIERFWQVLQTARLRMHHLDALRSKGSAAAAAMFRPMTFDFNQTPLSDIVEFFGQYAGVELVLSATDKEIPVTRSLQEVSMAWGLDMILFDTELTWDVQGNTIFIGDEKAVAAFRAQTDATGNKPKK